MKLDGGVGLSWLGAVLLYGAMLVLGWVHAQAFVGAYSGFVQVVVLSVVWTGFSVLPSQARAVRAAFVFAWSWFVVGLYWLHFSMHEIGGLPAGVSWLAIAFLSTYFAAGVAGVVWVWRRWFGGRRWSDFILVWPMLWLGGELLRGYVLGGMPSMLLGYAQVDNRVFSGWFAVLGVYGVGLMTAVAVGTLTAVWVYGLHSSAWMLRGWPWRGLEWLVLLRARCSWLDSVRAAQFWVVCCGVWASLVVVGWVLQGVSWGGALGAPVKVRVVQPNVAQSVKFERDELLRTTDFALSAATMSPAQLTVLPETVLPYPWVQAPEAQVQALDVALDGVLAQTGFRRAVLMGAVAVSERNQTYFNSALWLDGAGDVWAPSRYDKIHLLPFGESIPYGLGWFIRAMNIPLGGYGVGQSRTPFVLDTPSGPVRFGANICYENVFGEELVQWHDLDQLAPNVWVNVTNLGWFGVPERSGVFAQFLYQSRARAMELGRPMLTVNNTGVTAHIGPGGEILDRLPAQARGVADWSVQPMRGATPYAFWGQWPLWGLWMIWGLMWLRARVGPSVGAAV